MARDAWWLTDADGREAGGSGLSMTLRDAARLSQFALQGRRGDVSPGWFAAATSARVGIGSDRDGYGLGWWTYPNGRLAARGIFGQSILVNPAHRVVIAITSDWPCATDADLSTARALRAASDRRRGTLTVRRQPGNAMLLPRSRRRSLRKASWTQSGRQALRSRQRGAALHAYASHPRHAMPV